MNAPIVAIAFAGSNAQVSSPDGSLPKNSSLWTLAAALAVVLASIPGCSLTPHGTSAERERLRVAGQTFETPIGDRDLPQLSESPSWQEVLHRAFLANGDLESAYFDWKAAVERIGIASAYPNSNVSLGYSYMLSSERMNTFDRMTFSVGFDSMENLAWPTKVQQAGKVALDEARVSGERFRAAKFELQKRVLTTLAEYALLAHRERIEQENLGLLRLTKETLLNRVQTGTAQPEWLRAEIEIRASEDRLKTLEAELAAKRAELNGMLVQTPDAPLAPELLYLQPRPSPRDDVAVLTAAIEFNPDIARWVRQVEGRQNALQLARMQWIPDINPSVMITGGIAQAIGAGIMLPTTIAEIEGTIRESQSMVRAAEATLRQVRADSIAQLVATLISMRNSERQANLFHDSILPLVEQIVTNVKQSYSTGTSEFIELIKAQRTLLDVQLTIAEANAQREQRLAELESMLAVDIETLTTPSGQPIMQPTEPDPVRGES